MTEQAAPSIATYGLGASIQRRVGKAGCVSAWACIGLSKFNNLSCLCMMNVKPEGMERHA